MADIALKIMLTGGILCLACLVVGPSTTDFPRFNRACFAALFASALTALASALILVWSL